MTSAVRLMARAVFRARASAARQSGQARANAQFIGPLPPGQNAPMSLQDPMAFAGPIAAGIAAQSAFSVGNAFLAATASSQPFRWQEHAGAILSTMGAIGGEIFGGPGGAVVGAGVFGGIGSTIQGVFGAGMNLYGAQNAAMATTGMSAAGSYGFAQGMASLPGYGGAPIGRMGGYQALGDLGGFMWGGGTQAQVSGLAANFVGAYGDPSGPGFQAAAGGLGPTQLNPVLNAAFLSARAPQWVPQHLALSPSFADPSYHLSGPPGHRTPGVRVGDTGVYDAFNELGPAGAQAAISRFKSPLDQETFTSINTLSAGMNRVTRGAADLLAVAGSAVSGAEATGNRDIIGSAFGAAETAAKTAARVFGVDVKLYQSEVDQGVKSAFPLYTAAKRMQDMAIAAEPQYRTGGQSRGPSGDWIAENTQMHTDIAIASMDPLAGFVSPAARRAIVLSDSARLAEIAQQLSGPNVTQQARANLSGERSNLQIDMASQQIAIRQGIAGQMIATAAGMPSGAQAWGLQAMSMAAVQAHDRGISQNFGGTGAHATYGQGGTDPTIRALLERIALALESGRGHNSGAAGNGGNSAYALVRSRANAQGGW